MSSRKLKSVDPNQNSSLKHYQNPTKTCPLVKFIFLMYYVCFTLGMYFTMEIMIEQVLYL